MSKNQLGTLWSLSLCALASACLPKAQIEVLQPADVALPTHIQTVAVIDRSRPSNVGQRILGTIEGLITGEGLQADRDAAGEAVRGVTETLRISPRFEVVQPTFDAKSQETSLFDKEMSFENARKICKQFGCDGIVALEAFDSDSWVGVSQSESTSTDENGREVTTILYEVDRETQVMSAWRVYDIVEDSVRDDVRDYAASRSWTETGNTEEEARSRLPAVYNTVMDVGYDAGRNYGRRIAPTYVWVTRSYYGGGDPRLKEARNYSRASDWSGASKIWAGMVNDPDPKIRGKAKFNIALATEIDGDLDAALEHAKGAATDLGNGRSRQYVRVLQWRISDRARLEEQLAPPPAPERPPPSETSIQGDDGQEVSRGSDESQEVTRGSDDEQEVSRGSDDEQEVSRGSEDSPEEKDDQEVSR